MKKAFQLLVILLSFLLFGGTFDVFGEPTVKWFQADFPPAFILHGSEKGTGYCDRMQKDVTAALTDYTHLYFESNYKRIVRAFRMGNNVCSASIYKTAERQKFAVYSTPLFIGLSNGIIMLKKNVEQYSPYITAEGELDLKNLLAHEKDVQLGVLYGRNYGETIEAALRPFRGTDKIFERSKHDFDELLNVLLKGRMDIILALPMEITYALQKAGVDREQISFLMITGGKKTSTAYMACTRNDWGYSVVEKINNVIQNKRSDFAKYYRDWLDESSARTYEKLVWEVFKIDLTKEERE